MNRFSDRYVHTIDSKGRVQLTREIRTAFGLKKGDVLHLLPNPGRRRFLEVRTDAQWDAFFERLMAEPPGPRKRDVVRFVSLMHEKTTADAQGRIVLPQGLRDFCGLDGEVAVINMHTYVEIWRKDRIEQKYEQMLKAFNEVTDLLY